VSSSPIYKKSRENKIERSKPKFEINFQTQISPAIFPDVQMWWGYTNNRDLLAHPIIPPAIILVNPAE
jgi:hypothetical protein